MGRLDPKDFLVLDHEQIAITYSGALVDVFGICKRPTTKLLEEAAALAFDRTNAHGFAQALSNAIKLCRSKLKSLTSGRKQHPAVFAVLQAMKKADLSDSFEDRSRSPPRLGKFAATFARNRTASSPPRKIRPVVDVDAPSPAARSRAVSSSRVFSSPKKLRPSIDPTALSPASRRASIFASYGLVPDNARRAPSQAHRGASMVLQADSSVVDLCSSQEDDLAGGGSSSSTAKALPPKLAKSFLDSSILQLVRHCGGNRQVAIMSPGASGFMEGRFENDPEVHCSEVPNILYAKMHSSSSLRVMKQPAARKAPPPVEEADAKTEAASTDQEGEEEEGVSDSEDQVPPTVAYPPSELDVPPVAAETAISKKKKRTEVFQAIAGAVPLEKRRPHTICGAVIKMTVVAGKGYLVQIPKGKTKPECLVNLSAAMARNHGKNHGEVLVSIFDRLVAENKKFSKEVAVRYRDELLVS